jgi:hypothetical protein
MEAVEKRKIPSTCRDTNTTSFRPQLSVIPLSYLANIIRVMKSGRM